MYRINIKFTNLVRVFIPLGIALLSGFFLEILAPVKNLSFAFIFMGLVSNYFYPEFISLEKDKLKIKTVLSKNFKEFSLSSLEIAVDKRARYLILNLDRQYRIDVTTLPKELYYQLKPYIKIVK